MSQTTANPESQSSRVVMGALFIWAAVIIYAASNSIVSLLADIGREHPVMGRNAITLCNLLFLGSLISLVPMVFMFWRDWTMENLRKLTRRDWAVLSLSAFLSSALTPALFFIALDHTTVTNVVLIGRIEPPLFLLATVLLLGEKLDPWALLAGLVALCGAVVMFVMNSEGGLVFGKGEVATIAATLSFIASTLVTRVGLQGIPLGIFSIYRTVLGTIIYYFLGLYLYGPQHFEDLFEPIVLKWVWVYAIIVIICGQFAWNLGLKNARSGDISLATSFSPVAALIIAMLLLGENPGPGLVPGGLIILVAIAIGQVGRLRSRQSEEPDATTEETEEDCETAEAMKAEGRVNFKGA
ncbi:MAG: DMT family transporter [Pseudomonadota bacterium]